MSATALLPTPLVAAQTSDDTLEENGQQQTMPASQTATSSDPKMPQSLRPDNGILVLDIQDSNAADTLSRQRCDDQAEEGRLAGEIVVCRSLGEESDGVWDPADFERRYAQATRGINAPDVDGTGLRLSTLGSVISVTVTVRHGEAPPPPLIIDIEALPEAPPGSDAERIGLGLSASGK